MPLARGTGKQVFRKNIREMVRAGHPEKQAVAAAFREKRVSAAKKAARTRRKGT